MQQSTKGNKSDPAHITARCMAAIARNREQARKQRKRQAVLDKAREERSRAAWEKFDWRAHRDLLWRLPENIEIIFSITHGPDPLKMSTCVQAVSAQLLQIDIQIEHGKTTPRRSLTVISDPEKPPSADARSSLFDDLHELDPDLPSLWTAHLARDMEVCGKNRQNAAYLRARKRWDAYFTGKAFRRMTAALHKNYAKDGIVRILIATLPLTNHSRDRWYLEIDKAEFHVRHIFESDGDPGRKLAPTQRGGRQSFSRYCRENTRTAAEIDALLRRILNRIEQFILIHRPQ